MTTTIASTRCVRRSHSLLLLRRPLLVLLALVLVVSCMDTSTTTAAATTTTTTTQLKKDYDIVSVIHERGSNVAVVRRNHVLYMLYDETIIGAEFDDPELRLQAAYPGFAIMQAAAYLNRRFERAAQIGLGIGTVPSFLRAKGIPTDVIEISDAVVRQAADYFQYDDCRSTKSKKKDEDDNACRQGETFVADGLVFLESPPQSPTRQYDLLIVDVYTGFNPVAFYTQDVLLRIRDTWLQSPARGVVVVNFVGLFVGDHAVVPKSIFKTLQSVFTHVQCFREMDNLVDDSGASNIVFFASNEPLAFDVPTDGFYAQPDANTYYYIIANFPKWEIFTDLKHEGAATVEVQVSQQHDADPNDLTFHTTSSLPTAASTAADVSRTDVNAAATSAAAIVLTATDYGEQAFAATHAFTQQHMRERVVEQFPPSFWADVQAIGAAQAVEVEADRKKQATSSLGVDGDIVEVIV